MFRSPIPVAPASGPLREQWDKQTRSATFPRFSNSVAYYGLAMDLHKFGLNLYLVQALFGIIDIPAMLLATITMIYVGRRATVASFLIVAGLTVIANMFVPEGEPSSAPALTARRGFLTQGSRRGRCLGPHGHVSGSGKRLAVSRV